MSESSTCYVCGHGFPDDYGKYDPHAPVYADDYMYHLGCSDGVFEEVYAEVGP